MLRKFVFRSASATIGFGPQEQPYDAPGIGSLKASSSFWISSDRAPRDIELGLSESPVRPSVDRLRVGIRVRCEKAIEIVRGRASRTLRTRLARPKAGEAMRLWHLRRSLKAAGTHIATKPPRE